MKTTYRVEGMTCGGCVRSVTKALQLAGYEAKVDLDSKTAEIEGDVDDDKVETAIEDAGYDFGGRVSAG